MYFYISCILQTPKVHKNVFQRSLLGALGPTEFICASVEVLNNLN